ncbi:MAG: HD domain-containing protein [Bacteroides sp.]|nr:HD domain-containing protein [Bacteroides sp.]MCM1548993.1 HD domain-containing protein [Clostridium sp.]
MEAERDIFSGDTVNRYLSEDFNSGLAHGMCVSDLAAKLARELGLRETEVQEIALAGMLHDIGKLKISRYIYGRKEDTMKIEEARYIRRHAQLGEQILRKQGMSEPICSMVLYHHENFDGSGYPFNLRGEEIPLGARILRVCDVFVALISDRPYRKAFDTDTAIQLLIDEVKNFDMRVFLAFQSVIHNERTLKDLEEIEALEHLSGR